ncbi:MAG: hypothetical protein JXL85_05315 [Bacilli bacterium]|nr:hypothetical protein [Bacilli bacterium]
MKDNGFTFIESLIGGILFSLIGLAMIVFFSISVKGSSLAERKSISAVKAKNMDYCLRDVLAKITPPYWVREMDIRLESTYFSINYVNSNKNDFLFIKNNDNVCTISIPEHSYTFPATEITDISMIKINGMNMGINIEYIIDNNKFVSKSLFSSFPIGESDE